MSTQPAVRFAITKLPSQAPHSSTEVYFAPNRRYICIYTYIFKIETFIFLFVCFFFLFEGCYYTEGESIRLELAHPFPDHNSRVAKICQFSFGQLCSRPVNPASVSSTISGPPVIPHFNYSHTISLTLCILLPPFQISLHPTINYILFHKHISSFLFFAFYVFTHFVPGDFDCDLPSSMLLIKNINSFVLNFNLYWVFAYFVSAGMLGTLTNAI